MTKPAWRRLINRHAGIVAEQGYGVPLDMAAQAFGSGLIVDGKPEKRHGSDDGTDRALKFYFSFADVPRGGGAHAPTRASILVGSDEGSAHDEPEDRAPMISAAALRLAAMLRKARPECCT